MYTTPKWKRLHKLQYNIAKITFTFFYFCKLILPGNYNK